MIEAEIVENLRDKVFYHGTSLPAARAIRREGFRVWYRDEELGRVARGGNLGRGVYVSCDYRTALWFGNTLLRVSLRPATRILDCSVRPDVKALQYLQREFGRQILTRPPWKVVPANKKLKLAEVIAVFRHHYWAAWTPEKGFRWRRGNGARMRLLDDFRKLLVRYGFDGYGHPEDDNGLVVFAGDRVTVDELVAEVPLDEHDDLVFSDASPLRSMSIDDFRSAFCDRTSPAGKRLAARFAAAAAE